MPRIQSLSWFFQVRALYAVEKQAKDTSVANRLRLRQEQSTPVLAELREKFLTWKEQSLC